MGLIIVDNSKFFISEVREEMVKEFSKTLGFGLFSNSISLIQSIRIFFELLWKSDELNEKLKDHERLQEEFINIASHEIKTPIQAILTYSELMQSEPEKNQTNVDAIQRNALRLKLLSNNLLDMTRIQSKTLMIRKERFDLTHLVLSIVEDFRYQLRNMQADSYVEIEFQDPGKILVDADKERITQIITNLIHNALKFTRDGAITVSLKKENGEITVSIKDTGVGIDHDIMSSLFTKFATKHHSGTGVGLYISKNIVEAHGGKIWGRNNTNGIGATFAFTLPAPEA